MNTMHNPGKEPIAIIGMGLRFPGASTPPEYWQLLRQGRDMVREVPSERWDLTRLYDADATKPGKMVSRWGAFLDNIDQFDAKAFRISPREAKYLDPQHRLLLEIVWEAFEDAGIPLEEIAQSRTSVTIGQVWNDYLRMQSKNWSKLDGYTSLGSMPSLASNRISYVFDLQGPSVTLDTACSSSLASIYYACQSLWSGEADLAIAGGVELMLSPDSTIMMSKAGLLSPTGQCRTFDAQADGFVRGEGAGVVILKPLSQIRHSDRVYALLTGIGLNHNGHNEWIMAVNPRAQEEVIQHAHAQAGINPNTIDYVELHSAGLPKGDPLEAQILGNIWQGERPDENPCRVGSVKTNFGHLGAAAGVAGLMKVALSLYHREIFPTLHFQQVNPAIDLTATGLQPQTELINWPEKDGIPRAAVTSVGLSGSNAHAVLQAVPQNTEKNHTHSDTSYLLPISARSPEALTSLIHNYATLLAPSDTHTFSTYDLCANASVGRSHHEYRVTFQGSDTQALAEKLQNFLSTTSPQKKTQKSSKQLAKIAFALYDEPLENWQIFCKELQREPAFGKLITECDQILDSLLDWSLLAYLDHATQEHELTQQATSLIGIFVHQLGLTALWQTWGITPNLLLSDNPLLAQTIATLLEARSLSQVLPLLIQQHQQFFPQLQLPHVAATVDTASLFPTLTYKELEQQQSTEQIFILAFTSQTPSTTPFTASNTEENSPYTVLFSPETVNTEDYRTALLQTVSILYQQGHTIRWSQVYSEQFHHIDLPTYPWQRKRAWLDWLDWDEINSAPEQNALSASLYEHPLLHSYTAVAYPANTHLWHIYPLSQLTPAHQELTSEHLRQLYENLVSASYASLKRLEKMMPIAKLNMHNAQQPAKTSMGQILITIQPEHRVAFQIFWQHVKTEEWELYASGTADLIVQEKEDVSTFTQNGSLRDQLKQTSSEKRPLLLLEVLNTMIADLLELESLPTLESGDSIFVFGLDSLTISQLINILQKRLECSIPFTLLFSSPTLGDFITSLLQKLFAAENSQTTDLVLTPAPLPIVSVPSEEADPLSFAQQRLWFLEKLTPGTNVYNEHSALRIRGNLHIDALEHSIRKINQNHPMLHTTFHAHNGQPVQQQALETGAELSHVKLSDLSEYTRETITLQLAEQILGEPFDLEKGPLTRFCLFEIGPTDFLLLVVFHHIIADGWSLGILYRELENHYSAFITGKPSLLPLPSITYTDFVRWQQQSIQGERLQEQEHYWVRQLANAPTILELPTDYPRPAVLGTQGSHHIFTLSSDLTQRIRTLSKQEGVTVYMTLLTALHILLGRYSGQDDVLIGTSLANRSLPELEKVVGLFLNNVVMRGRLNGNPTFQECLQRTKQTVVDAFQQQDMPFEQLLQALHIQRDLSRSPLFQVLFVLQDKAWVDLTLPELQIETHELESHIAKFDLYLSLADRGDDLYGSLEYNTNLFKPETIERMVEHFAVVLEMMSSLPEQSIATFPLLTRHEQQTMLNEWNDTSVPYPLTTSVIEQIAQHAELTPEAIALVYQDQHLTYSKMLARAHNVAQELYQAGVGTHQIIGLYMPRSIETVISILAVWLTGNAYLPLDLLLPKERIATILAEARPSAILTYSELQTDLPPTLSSIICLDTIRQHTSHQAQTFIASYDPQQLAYVIYTSGSTGQPKGAMIHHQGMLNHLSTKIHTLQLTSTDRVAQTASYCFDISIWQFFAALLSGGQVHILPDEVTHDPVQLLQAVEQEQFTILEVVPSLLRTFLEICPPSELAQKSRDLRWLLVTGEALPTELCQRWYQVNQQVPLLNAYGPTECSDDVTQLIIANNPNNTFPIMPIGRPLANIRLYIVDKYWQPVPIGVAGELLVGGIGVGQGYLSNPQRTAQAFIPDPFSQQKGNRLYRTGDLVRYQPDGTIEFLGRIDHQVKVRGYRIELGEIEALLDHHPAVRESVVLVREDIPGNQQIVAYVVSTTTGFLTKEALQNFLHIQLPSYMLPNNFVFLDALPLNSNGKIDRGVLLTLIPEEEQSEREAELVPFSETEELLAEIWRSLLGRTWIGRHENFFEIGGHSLLATQLISRVRDHWHVEIPLRNLFQSSTIESFSLLIETYQQIERGYTLPTIQPAARDTLIPLSFAQQRLWYLDQLVPESATYNLCAAIRLTGEINVSGLAYSLREIVQRHESLRTVFRTIQGSQIQVILPSMPLDIGTINLTHLSGTQQEIELEQLLQEQVRKPLDLINGPLLRACLFQQNTNEATFLLTIHHIVSDGWSLGVFIREFGTLYNAYMHKQPAELAELPIQYADFAIWQRKWMDSDTLQSQLRYWKEHLADVPTRLELPTDRPHPIEQTFTGSQFNFMLPKQLIESLQIICRDEGVTLFMMLLAAWHVLLYRYSHQERIAVGTAIANRDHVEMEKLIGFFVNTLVMYADLAENPTFKTFLQQIRQICLEAYANQHVPFEQVVEAVQPERVAGISPLFQVMFVLQNTPLSDLTLQGIELEFLPVNTGTAKFDLTLSLMETAQGLTGNLEYNSDLFDESTIKHMTTHYRVLLENIVKDIQQRLASIPLLDKQEEQQILIEWNTTQSSYPHQATITGLFEEQVLATPDAVALRYQNKEMTYQELNAQANQLAHYLQTLGITCETPVGISITRSFEMIISILAILKTGGAYVPLDPNYPQERLTYILEDTQLSLILTDQQFAEQLPGGNPLQIIYTEEYTDLLVEYSTENMQNEIWPEQLAYIMYTSGSTGQPKGVCAVQRAVVRLVRETNYVSFGPEDTFLQLAPSSFDASTLELWGSLLNGGRLVLFPSHTPSLEELAQVLHDEQINVLWLTAGLFHQMVEHQLSALSNLRYLLAGGDILAISQVQKVLQLNSDCTLINGYGPTENTTFTCCYPMQRVEQISTSVPIGSPISNTTTYLLDSFMHPVPIGVAGELYTGGDGLARGYLNRAEITAEHFVPNPFSTQSGARLYKTGDLARYRSDGLIEFIGRNDNQVKIRGFRIELGEIENILLQHPAVADGTVIVHRDKTGTKRLIAYLVYNTTLSAQEIRNYLLNILPDYMIPASFISLEQLPLTNNGKIDRRALPDPEYVLHIDENERNETPKDDVETLLMEIWSQVLGVSSIGLQDNFFGSGGDSILSIQIVAQAAQHGIRLHPKHFFQYQTIAEMAQMVNEQQAFTTTDNTIEQDLIEGEIPLTAIQHWFFELGVPVHHWNQATLLQLSHPIQPDMIEQAFTYLFLHHDALRIRYTYENGSWQQTISAQETLTSPIPCQVIDIAHLSQAEQQKAILLHTEEAQQGMNIEEGPLVRVVYFQPDEGESVRLFIAIHHLIIDSVSWRLLLEDLQNICEQLDTYQEIQLPPKTASFQQWSQAIQQYAQEEACTQELSYWKQQGRNFVVDLPTDRAHGKNTVDSVQTQIVTLAQEETHSLLYDVPLAYQTHMNDILLTALSLTLTRWNGKEQITINLEGHGREDLCGLDISRTIGWFTSIYPVHFDLSGCNSLDLAIKSVKEQLHTIPNHGIGYGLLRYLASDTVKNTLNEIGNPQISFNYLGQFQHVLSEEQMFVIAPEPFGSDYSRQGQRHHLLDIACRIINGKIQFEWTYSQNIYNTETISELAEEFLSALRAIIEHCQEPGTGGYTPSDFPLAILTQSQIDLHLTNNPHKRNIEDIYPLTPLQQGLLFHSLYEPDNGDYVIQVGMTFTNGFNERAFHEAWVDVMQNNAILRTGFWWKGLSETHQIVYQDSFLPIVQQDWRHLTTEKQQAHFKEYQYSDRLQGFQLSQAPLMRLFIARLSDEKYTLLWSYHHLLLDGWSLPLILESLFTSYAAIEKLQSIRQPGRPHFREYIRWLRQQDQLLAQEFWKEKLRGFYAPTPLGIDHTQQEPQKAGYAELSNILSVTKTLALTRLARHHHITINTLMQAAWALLLSHYSGEDDIVFGTVTSGRTATIPDIEKMVGLFINTLPIRTQIAPQTSVKQWLYQLHKQQTEITQYAYTPLTQIQSWSEVPRGTQLFESLLVFENYPLDTTTINMQDPCIASAIQSIQVTEQTSYLITLVVTPGHQLKCKMLYDRECFSSEAISRMLQQLEQILQDFTQKITRPLIEMQLWSHQEYEQIKKTALETTHTFPVEQTLQEIFEAQVERQPHAIAAICEHITLNYQELNQRANRVAHYLHQLGVGPDVNVGLCVERSLELLIGILAILKAGGTYIPLDPSYPPERLAYILEDARISILLTQEHLRANLPTISEYVIGLDTITPLLSLEKATNPLHETDPDNAAYIIYTSGSTGNPKGVVVSHANVVRLFTATAPYYHFDDQDAWTLFHSYAFDFSVWEIWGALLHGGRLVVVPFWISRSPELFYQLLHTHKITVLNQTPSAFNQLMQVEQTEEQRKQLALRLVIFGGEALEIQSLRPWFNIHGDQQPQLVNMYGITETTVHVTYRPISEQDLHDNLNSVIGIPMSDLEVIVMDHYGQPAPIGVAGEMYIGGDGLARGYLNRPELTAERFIPHPFSNRPGARLYRSGDLARRLPDGDIEYLGRIDQQVKIRGFRIELGEIETTIGAHPMVYKNIVLPHQSRMGTKQLIAYVVKRQWEDLSETDLQAYLQEKLPHYMVPAAIIFLAALPLNHNGKVDRRALPEPDNSIQDDEKRYVAPFNDIQKILANVWAEVLHLERVGIQDNFFSLGGDSIVSIQIIGRASQLGLHLTPKQIFQYQTIEQLSQVVNLTPIIEAQQGLITGSIPLTPIQHWFFTQQQPYPAYWNQSITISVTEPLHPHHLKQALARLLEHHDALRLRFRSTASGWQQTNEDLGEPLAFDYIDLSMHSVEEQQQILRDREAQAQMTLDITAGPLLKAVYFHLNHSESPDQLLLIIHHLAVDGVSWRIILDDLQTLYRQCQQSEPMQLPKKTTSFQAWSEHLEIYASSNQAQQEADYWLQETSTPGTTLPGDTLTHEQHNTAGQTKHIETILPAFETRILLESLPEIYHTQINDVLLTALAQILAQWQNTEDILIDLEGHGREDLFTDVDLSRTVGWFTSIFPVKLKVPAGSNTLELLKEVKEHLRNIPQHGIGYGIIRYLNQDTPLGKELQKRPQPQVVFNYLGQLEAPTSTTTGTIFSEIRPSDGPTQHPENKRNHLLEINSIIQSGQLHVTWAFSPQIHSSETITNLANAYMQALQTIVTLAQTPQSETIYIPSDFPDLDVSQEELTSLLAEIDLGE